jgi:hypothetical protein
MKRIIQAMVAHPDEVNFKVTESRIRITFEVHAHPDDLVRIIGRWSNHQRAFGLGLRSARRRANSIPSMLPNTKCKCPSPSRLLSDLHHRRCVKTSHILSRRGHFLSE